MHPSQEDCLLKWIMTDEVVDLPYRVEYAKSGRAACEGCKQKIDKGEFRLAIMVQSPFHDGKLEHWPHFKCFFLQNRPKAVGYVSYYHSLRWENQENIKKMLEIALKGGLLSSVAKKKKRAKNGYSGIEKVDFQPMVRDFRLEYAKSGGSKCGVCEEKIGKKSTMTSGTTFLALFIIARQELEYFDAGEVMTGFFTLSPEDQTMIKTELKVNYFPSKFQISHYFSRW